MSKLRYAFILLASLAAALCVACSSTPSGSDDKPADKTAIETITSGLQTMFTWHPGADTSRLDAFRRATPWLTDKFAATSTTTSERGPGVQWDQWARARSTVEATVLILGTEHGADTDQRIDRLAMITQDVKAPGGTVVDSIDLTAKVTLQRSGRDWRIDSVEFV
ncbi:hypothetical protein [Nocardia sp. NPDC049526]|uniref:hypothetical protein n=1 Tax=Nocardia sp. NPDC049526 TaxID=3364316 RepID=UPI0037AC3A58